MPPAGPWRLDAGGSLFPTRPTPGNRVATPEEPLARTADIFGQNASGEAPAHAGGQAGAVPAGIGTDAAGAAARGAAGAGGGDTGRDNR